MMHLSKDVLEKKAQRWEIMKQKTQNGCSIGCWPAPRSSKLGLGARGIRIRSYCGCNKNQAGSSAEARVSCRWFEFPWADHSCRQRHYFIFYYHDHSIFRASWLTPTNVSRCLFEILSHVLQLSCSCPQSCLEAANFVKKVRISPCKAFHPGKRFDISQHKCCLCGLPKSAQFKSIP